MKFLIFIFSLIVYSNASATENLITLYSSSAEEAITTEEMTLDLLINELPEYKFKKLNASLHRSLKFIEQKNENSCIRNLRKNHRRESLLLFSHPQTIFLGLKAYLSPRASSLFTGSINEPTDIYEFITQNNFILGVDKERSYNSKINAQIFRIPKQNRYVKGGRESEERMAQMLFSNRIDVWLEYQTVMEVYKEQYLGDNQILSFSVIGADDFVTGHIACKKTEENKIFINAVNASLVQLYKNKKYYDAHIMFVNKNLKQVFKQHFDDFVAKY
ncbi:hypothetical protein KO525_08895 [Psychrosphaera sp. B3R10]|uniref:hypothetical protein n=1 Tax=unclassified Psychrosphaera TaxID=2641570 RepID=UPI001C0A074A|nr:MULTISPECIES: hypothetical protein [unclassified Psychrosphaera]MBU2881497.1 hypothetical protein [Psychrosphaera sp. I2R16]MBU2989491.1 hypothetical protein [Psychrosphaera sp. B3R10]MDO6719215.1 hypothetical protein [Psychrosphaera sp. 1_MG-2023]